MTRMTTVGAQGRCNGNGVTKEPGNSRKHLIQMFHCRMEECSSAANRSTNNQYVCKYIGCINDQSNWSGPFSLMVMMLDYRSRGTWFDPTGIFSLQVYFSSCYTVKPQHKQTMQYSILQYNTMHCTPPHSIKQTNLKNLYIKKKSYFGFDTHFWAITVDFECWETNVI